jgi:hypothetical protein
MKKAPESKIMKLLNLPLKERVGLLKKLMANDQRAWQYFYRNFADGGLVEGKSMNQFHYMMALDECEKIDGNRGNADFNKYIYKKAHASAMTA